MTIDFEAEAHMADLRMRVLAQLDAEKRGEPFTPISPDEYRFLVLDLLRGRDMAAARARTDAATLRKAKSSPKPAPAPLDLQEILDQLS